MTFGTSTFKALPISPVLIPFKYNQGISQVTNEVMEEVRAWQNRPLDSVYPIVYLDALA